MSELANLGFDITVANELGVFTTYGSDGEPLPLPSRAVGIMPNQISFKNVLTVRTIIGS